MIIRKGFSLTELIVSVTIFVTVITMTLGGIATVSRTKMLISSMKESQQKVRLITEMMSRYGKEAIFIAVNNTGERVDYFFEDGNPVQKTAKIFKLTQNGTPLSYNSLFYYSCGVGAVGTDDALISGFSNYIDNPVGTPPASFDALCSREELLSSRGGFNFQVKKIGSAQFFEKHNTIPSSLNLKMELYNLTDTNMFFNDAIKIEKTILLENLK